MVKLKTKNIKAKTKLIIGPAIEIIPFLLLSTHPLIITAPGAAKTNPKKLIAIANNSIWSKLLNSAKHL